MGDVRAGMNRIDRFPQPLHHCDGLDFDSMMMMIDHLHCQCSIASSRDFEKAMPVVEANESWCFPEDFQSERANQSEISTIKLTSNHLFMHFRMPS